MSQVLDQDVFETLNKMESLQAVVSARGRVAEVPARVCLNIMRCPFRARGSGRNRNLFV